MNRNKKIFSFAILAASVATTLCVISTLNTNRFAPVKAEDCTHSGEIGYYEATAYVIEHWACCECHQAWADEARTILVRGTDFDNTRSDTTYQFAIYHDPIVQEDGTEPKGSYGWSDNAKATFDSKYGIAYSHEIEIPANQIYMECFNAEFNFEEKDSYEIEISNNTNAFLQVKLLHANWGEEGLNNTHVNIPAGEKGKLTITSTIISDGSKSFVLRAWDNYGKKVEGSITVTKPLAVKTLADFLNDLNNLELPKDFDTNAYFAYYLNNVRPVLNEINATFGNNIPAELSEKYNYFSQIFYGGVENGYTSFGYGSHTVSTTVIDGVEFIKLHNITAFNENAQFSYQITNVTYSNYKYFMFKVFNPFDKTMKIVTHDNWDAWNGPKDQTFYVDSNSWATILVNKEGYNQGIIGVQCFDVLSPSETTDKEVLISPIIDYIYDWEELDNAVYGHKKNHNLRGVDGGNGLPISKKITANYGTVYSINDINDRDCPRVYLSGKENTDATQLKFYVKNETNKVLWVSSDCFNWSIEQFHHQIQLGGVGIGEWVEFTMDAEHFNYGSDLYINFGAADRSLVTGTILVSAFVVNA